MEIAIVGQGEVVIRFIDQHGDSLLQERLVVSGLPDVEALRYVPPSIGTVGGPRRGRPRARLAEQSPAARDLRRRRPRALRPPLMQGHRLHRVRDAQRGTRQGAGPRATRPRPHECRRAVDAERAAGRVESRPRASLTERKKTALGRTDAR